MKYLGLICISLALFTCGTRESKNDLERSRLIGKVKSITVSSHDPIEKFGKVDYDTNISNRSIIYSQNYNENGFEIEFNLIDRNGKLLNKLIHKYDENDNNIESITYNPDGSLESKTINIFDDSNELIESKDFDDNGKLTRKEESKHDSLGNIIRTKNNQVNWSLFKTVNVFNKNYQNIETYYYKNDSLLNLTKRKYDNHNNKIEEVTTKGNLITYKAFSKYDNKNILIEDSTYEPNPFFGGVDNHRKYIYEFDDVGNWTKKITFANDKATSVEIREIEYY